MTLRLNHVTSSARRALFASAAAKVVVGAGLLLTASDAFIRVRSARDVVVWLAAMALFSGAGAMLLLLQRGDRRATYFGGFLLLCAAAFSDDPLRLATAGSVGVLHAFLKGLASLAVVAFLPLMLWLFACEFPRVAGGARSLAITQTFVLASLIAGAILFLSRLLADAGLEILAPLSGHRGTDLYWAILFALALPALVFTAWRARRATPDERRRVALFAAGFVIGFAPMVVEVLAEAAIPGFRRLMAHPGAQRAGASVIYPALLSLPITTSYAVLVQRALDLRLVLRTALRYALARYTVIAATILPFAVLVAYAWSRRAGTVTALVSDPSALGLTLAVALGLVATFLGPRILQSIDERFFREHYDGRRILTQLVEQSRAAADPRALAGLWIREIDRALHPESIAIMAAEPTFLRLVAVGGVARALAHSSPLVRLLSMSPGPVDVDLEDERSTLRQLPEDDRAWLADGGFRFLAPLIATEGSLVGIIALGSKRSELPFSREDRTLLAAVAAAGSLTLENRMLRSTPRAAPEGPVLASLGSDDARQCARCGRVTDSAEERCTECGGAMDPAPLPAILRGTFRVLRLVGTGGMCAVYRAVDLTLGRSVAIKVLPRGSPELAIRLRREARAIASILHPNLEVIHGAETWRGAPILVLEFMEGGTLAQKLRRSPLTPSEAVRIVLALTAVLERVHAAGFLHRDIKPSNIGFTADMVPKLLDFGLVRLLDSGRAVRSSSGILTGADTDPAPIIGGSLTKSGRLAGTPLYMSPEAHRGMRPDASFDLWGLAVVLYEAIAGVHPFKGTDIASTIDTIREASAADIRCHAPNCPAPIAEFLTASLHRDRARRPSSARGMREALELLEGVGGAWGGARDSVSP